MNDILKFFFRGLASTSNLVLALVLVTFLEKNITGIFFTLQATMVVFSLILRLGVDENIIRYINTYDSGVIVFLVQKIKVILLLLSIPTLISLYFFASILDFDFDVFDLLLFFICIFLFSLLSLFGRFFQAKEKHTTAILILNLLMPCFLILSIYAFSLYFFINLKIMIICFIMASFFTFCFCLLALSNNGYKTPSLVCENKENYSSFAFYKSSFFLLCIVFLQNLPFWFLSIYPMARLGSEAVAVLNFNLKIASAISVFSVFLNFILSPRVAKKYVYDSAGFISFYIKCFFVNFVFSVVFGGLFVAFYSYSIELLGVGGYENAEVFLNFILFYIFYSLCVYMTMIYSMIGKQSVSFLVYVITFFIFISLVFSILNESVESYSYLMLCYIVSNFFILFFSQIICLYRKKYA
ncbi:hypothetical protein QDG88_13745 [Pseudoalteromonas piscicida]|uniref:hypothetical protein n=1 Tax=Pseudoalteromonas piscicida TaxID=43662 RepID=UPI00273A190D|nr:hypothetical protein [Pseudoalteromonas piscicida]MDP4488983.1 hypothetical protein [Pseudoalteromonas piscicida]